MKDLAAGAGVKAPALYNHFPSKEAVLVEAVEGALEIFFAYVLGPLVDEPADLWLEHIVKRHTLFQIERAEIASANDLITTGEHRSTDLPDESFRRVRKVQMDYVRILRDLIQRSRPADRVTPSVAVTAFAVIAIVDRTNTWYRKGGALQPIHVASANWELVQKMLEIS